jgi:hypothetical protein
MIVLLCSLMKTCFMGIVQHEFSYYARRLYHIEGRIGLVLVCGAKILHPVFQKYYTISKHLALVLEECGG